ncbi:hypothetical protein [Methylobacterium sp. SD21]|uniref:hypothetical protein n=1 Tax=Methylobacterium litchii TaxID=3138810 RepID=UPI00313DBD0B
MPIKIKDDTLVRATIARTLQANAPFDISPDEHAKRIVKDLADQEYEVALIDHPDETPKLGTVAILTKEGERIVNAVAEGNYDELSEANYAAILSLRNKVLWAVKRVVTHDEVDEAKPADATQGDPSILAAARSATYASGDTLRKGAVVELPRGFAVVGTGIGIDTQHAIEPWAQAIRDCVEASRFQHRAAAVLGYDAVSELMSELPAPEGEAA